MPHSRYRTALTPTMLCLLLAHASSTARGEEQKPVPNDTYSVYAGVTFGDEQIVGDDDQTTPNPLFGLRWDHFFCYSSSFFIDAGFTLYNGDLPHGDVQEISARLGVQSIFGAPRSSNWFLNAAAGLARFDPEHAASQQNVVLGAGFGQRFPGKPGRAFFWE